MYPTIQMFGNADNLLLKPEYVDSCLEFVNVEFIKIKSNNEKGFEVDRVDSATAQTLHNDKLNWSGRALQWELNQSGMVAEFEYKADGKWECRDMDGHRIDPI